MLALIMAGGEGNRLNMGEKPLVSVAGTPMIARVIAAFISADCDVVVALSNRTPMTRNWCRASGIDYVPTGGSGYVEDMVEAVTVLGEMRPLFVAVSDLPCLTSGIIEKIRLAYAGSGKDACSTWVPLSLMDKERSCQYTEPVDGIEACPAGINILKGDLITRPQDEIRLLLNEPRLAFNINTRADLEFVNSFLLQ